MIRNLKTYAKRRGDEDKVAKLYVVVFDQRHCLSTVFALIMLYFLYMHDDASCCNEVMKLYSESIDEAAEILREVLHSGYGKIYWKD